MLHNYHRATFPGMGPSIIIGNQTKWPPRNLDACLEAIRTAAPGLETDPRFQHLLAYLHQHGRGTD